MPATLLTPLYPLLFVLLWSTGFIGAKFGLPHTEPLTFLLIRYLWVIGLMLPVVFLTRAPWPQDKKQWLHIGISGLLVHATYLGGVFTAIGKGLPAGATALIVGLQPVITGFIAAPWLGEKVQAKQWLGLVLGLVGTWLVVSHKAVGIAAVTLTQVLPAIIALLGITLGTLYQKKYCPRFDLRTGVILQFFPSAVVTGLLVWLTETAHVEWVAEFMLALAWLVLVLSFGAITLLNLLIRSGSAVNVASLFYLTPSVTALIAWVMFGEVLTLWGIAGMLIAAAGVYLARR
ncbi:DMT family transporter [Parvibium lacunae]|uniref:DMT family transporter n=1 Tax=Parvibium lacunae TaxID=1888893 RepID=A0A368L6K1_9BURK|nr:DMT family transporter [Parvibium lacunae]RCS59257.1 DMT family transporter [Parvibium lacunae]